MHVYIRMYAHMQYVFMSVYTCMYVCVCVYVCTCVCVCVCMCVCVWERESIYTHADGVFVCVRACTST